MTEREEVQLVEFERELRVEGASDDRLLRTQTAREDRRERDGLAAVDVIVEHATEVTQRVARELTELAMCRHRRTVEQSVGFIPTQAGSVEDEVGHGFLSCTCRCDFGCKVLAVLLKLTLGG